MIVCLRRPGFHCWPEAPEQVDFLRVRHRHLFCFRVEYEVSHGEREVEFFLARLDVCRVLQVHEREHGLEFGTLSCEDIAQEIHRRLPNGRKPSAVEVWEDGENGARLEW